MEKSRFWKLFSVSVICISFLISGCDKQVSQMVSLQMQPMAEQQATYKVLTESHQTLKYDGSFEDKSQFKDGHNINSVEMVFSQKIKGINSQGNILADITIESLKINAVFRDEPKFNFDSGSKDEKNPLSKLIGQGYSIELSPQLAVQKVSSIITIRGLVPGTSESHKRAQALLSDDEIINRHSVYGIGAENIVEAPVGGKWSSFKTLSFPVIGSKSYERIYTLKKIENDSGRRIAVIEMQGLPAVSAETSKFPALMDKLDNERVYEGHLKLDLDNGLIENYFEKFDSKWTFIDPTHDINSDEPPASFELGAIRLHSIERIN